MKIFKSIKWRLQIWYGLIPVFVLAGFGFAAYRLEVNLLLQRLEDEANRRFDILARALHPPPPHPPAAQPPFGGRPPNKFAPRSQPGLDVRALREFHLPPQGGGYLERTPRIIFISSSWAATAMKLRVPPTRR
jgi:hypothetical protein